MGKIIEYSQDTFSGGISEDKRVKNSTKFSLTKNFDAFTFAHKLVPYYKTVDCAGTWATIKSYNIVKFVYAPSGTLTAGNYKLYGLGVETSGGSKATMYSFDIDSSLDSVWTAMANGASAQNGRNTNVFFYYKSFLYFFWGGSYLGRKTIVDTTAIVDDFKSLAYTSVIQPVHHPADDCAYFFVNNDYTSNPSVYRLNNTTWDNSGSAVLTLPSNVKIVCAAPYGNYLAIGCVTLGGANIKSIVYLWDRDSSSSLISEIVDFGEGEIVHLANLSGNLIGVMDFYNLNSLGLRKGKILIKRAVGQFAPIINEINSDGLNITNPNLPKTSVISEGKLYFPAEALKDGDYRLGIWAVDANGNMALDFIEEDATSYQGIFKSGNTWFISHSGNGSVTHSDSGMTYSTTNPSVLEILSIDGDEPRKDKKLVGVSVMTEPMPTAGQIICSYRKNEETAWTTIFTHTTDNSLGHSAINIESDGSPLPTFKELQLQFSSTGGAVITGWNAKVEIIDNAVY